MWPAPPPQHLPALEWHVDQQMLRQTINSRDIDFADAAFALDKKEQLPARERTQVEQIANAQLFKTWIKSPSSAKLLVHWDRTPPRTIANISPLSIFCVLMSQMLQAHDRFVTAMWLCGRHIDPTESAAGGRSMLASLIDQLLRQHNFDTRSLAADGFDFERLRLGNLEELIQLLEWLVQRLPETITFVCFIDGVILYEREEMEALDSLACLIRLAQDHNIRAAVKLLFTSAPGTDIVRGAFEEEDLIMNVDTLPKMVWAPNDERVMRELGRYLSGV